MKYVGRSGARRVRGRAPGCHRCTRGQPWSWLRDRLADRGSPVSLTTLSYWRTGRRQPRRCRVATPRSPRSRSCCTRLRAPGLDGRAEPAYGSTPDPEVPLDDDAVREATEETLQALAAAPLAHHAKSASRWSRTWTSTAASAAAGPGSWSQATSGTIREIPWVEVAPVPTTSAPRFSQVVGARIVRTYRHPSGMVNGSCSSSSGADRSRHRTPRVGHGHRRGLPARVQRCPLRDPPGPGDPHLGAVPSRGPARVV